MTLATFKPRVVHFIPLKYECLIIRFYQMLSRFRIPLRNIILVRGSTKQRKKKKKKIS